MLTGRVAMQNLQEEDLNRDHRSQRRVVPSHARIAASLSYRYGFKLLRPILLETLNDIRDTAHGGPPLRSEMLLHFQYAGDTPLLTQAMLE